MEEPNWKDIANQAVTYLQWALAGLIDGLFLAFWVFLQWLINTFIANYPLAGVDIWILRIFQILFAVSTLTPTVLYVYVDMWKMVSRARKAIRLIKENA